MTGHEAPAEVVRDLLERATSRRGLHAWARGRGADEAPFARAVGVVMPLLTVDPALALRAAQRLHRLLPAQVRPLERILVQRLRAHALRASGEVGAAASAYADVVAFARAAREPLEAARTGIGWVQSLAVLGRVDEAARQARWMRPLLQRVDPAAAARLDTNLANAWMHVGDVARAQPLYRRAHATLSRLGRSDEAAHASFGLARAHQRRARIGAARTWLERTRASLSDAHPVLHAYVDLTDAGLDLVEGRSEEAIRRLHAARERLDALGDRRAAMEIDLQAATMLDALGSVAASRAMAAAAVERARALGSDLDLARAALIASRVEAHSGIDADVDHLLTLAADHLPTPRSIARDRLELERARWDLAAGRVEAAASRLRPLRARVDRQDRTGDGVRVRALLAEIALRRGQTARAIAWLQQARRDTRGSTQAMLRPALALLLARAYDQRGEGATAVRWARSAIDELETALLQWHASAWRRAGAQARDAHYGEAVEIVLRHGGRRAVERAADLAARARSPRMLEDLLHRVPATERAAVRRRWETLRTSLLADDERSDPSTRHPGRMTTFAPVHADEPESVGPPRVVRRAWRLRRLDSWRARLGEAQLVLYHRGPHGWRAFVVARRGAVRCVELPQVDHALATLWRPLRLLLETAARLPAERRQDFLARTHDEANTTLHRLREALWTPLCVEGSRVFVVPDADLHDLPLEALAHLDDSALVASRLPHPAFVQARARRPRGPAVVLHGPGEGQRREATTLRARLRRARIDVRVGEHRALLDRIEGAACAVHVAAHGAFRVGEGRLSGIELGDGWLGFEHLPPSLVRGALVVFASCESGLTSRRPGRDMEGWLSAGFALGTRSMVLTLWKVDDAGASVFADDFYARWLEGADPASAAAATARAARSRGEHPYRWAASFCAGV